MQGSGSAKETREIFESIPVPSALMKMSMPVIASQLISLVYNIVDTWFIAQTNNPYMVAASSLVLTVVMVLTAMCIPFSTGGATVAVQLMGSGDEEESRKVASFSLLSALIEALILSLLCLIFMDPLLRLLGASDNTIVYARQYMFFVAVLGGIPVVAANTMSAMVRNVGYSKQAGWGLSLGGIINVILDPIFMFVLLPDGYEVVGAAVATMLSNVIVCCYFLRIYSKLKDRTVLELPKRIEKIRSDSLKSIFAIGIPAAISVLLYDLTNIMINRLVSSHGDLALAAMGIATKAERLPLNITIGICHGMMPLIAYNYASGNRARMKEVVSTARLYGFTVSAASMVLYLIFAADIVKAFINDAETIRLGTEFLKVRCVASPVMYLCYHMAGYMQAIREGKLSFWMAIIRQLCLNIPVMFVMNHFMGATGVGLSQAIADGITAVISYILYYKMVYKKLFEPENQIQLKIN